MGFCIRVMLALTFVCVDLRIFYNAKSLLVSLLLIDFSGLKQGSHLIIVSHMWRAGRVRKKGRAWVGFIVYSDPNPNFNRDLYHPDLQVRHDASICKTQTQHPDSTETQMPMHSTSILNTGKILICRPFCMRTARLVRADICWSKFLF